jgi:hypothetical protein
MPEFVLDSNSFLSFWIYIHFITLYTLLHIKQAPPHLVVGGMETPLRPIYSLLPAKR